MKKSGGSGRRWQLEMEEDSLDVRFRRLRNDTSILIPIIMESEKLPCDDDKGATSHRQEQPLRTLKIVLHRIDLSEQEIQCHKKQNRKQITGKKPGKNRENDESTYEKMVKLKRDLRRAATCLELVKKREYTKKEYLNLTMEIFEKRYQAQDYSGTMLAEVTAMKTSRPAFAPIFANQYNQGTTWPKPAKLPCDDYKGATSHRQEQPLRTLKIVLHRIDLSEQEIQFQKKQNRKQITGKKPGKNRENDESTYEKMVKLKRDLRRAATCLELVKKREYTKKEYLNLTMEIFEKRYQAQDYSGTMLAEVTAMKTSRPAFAPIFANQYNQGTTWPKPAKLPCDDYKGATSHRQEQPLRTLKIVLHRIDLSEQEIQFQKKQNRKQITGKKPGKNRENDESTYEKMVKLKRDLRRAATCLELVKKREYTKKEYLNLTMEIFEKRYQAQDYSGTMLAEVTAMKTSRPAFAPIFANQYNQGTTWPKPAKLPCDDYKGATSHRQEQPLRTLKIVLHRIDLSEQEIQFQKKQNRKEHHQQTAVSLTGQQMATRATEATDPIIPTPAVDNVEDMSVYDLLYPPNYKVPKQLIQMQPFDMEQDIPDYDMDSDDEKWLDSQNLEIDALKFEKMIDLIEENSRHTLVNWKDASTLLNEGEDVSFAVHRYWLNKRLNTDQDLIPRVKTESRDRGRNKSKDPYVAFQSRSVVRKRKPGITQATTSTCKKRRST